MSQFSSRMYINVLDEKQWNNLKHINFEEYGLSIDVEKDCKGTEFIIDSDWSISNSELEILVSKIKLCLKYCIIIADTTDINVDPFNYCVYVIGDELNSKLVEGDMFFNTTITDYKEWFAKGDIAITKNNCEILDYFNGNQIEKYIVPEGTIVVGKAGHICPKNAAEIILHEGIEELSKDAFSGYLFLKKINLPESISKIGKNAFCLCTGLKELIFPASLSIIENKVGIFSGDYEILSLPVHPEKITKGAFYDVGCIHKLILPGNMSSFEKVFEKHGSITSVEFHDNAENYVIENEFMYDLTKKKLVLFINKNNNTSVVIPDGVEEICNSAFSGSTKLEKIKIPGTVKKIGNYAFKGCHSLIEIEFLKGLRRIEDSAIIDCHNLKKVIIPESISEIHASNFVMCPNLKTISMPNKDIKKKPTASGRPYRYVKRK